MKTKFTSRIILLGLTFALFVGVTSCKECKRCEGSATSETFLADTLVSSVVSTVTPIEYCGDELEVIEANPVVTQETEVDFFGETQKIVATTTWTCQ